MDIKQKIQKILRESFEMGKFTPTEEKIFNFLKSMGLQPDNYREIMDVLIKKMDIPDANAYKMFLLYKYNYNYRGRGRIKRVDTKDKVVRTANIRAREFVELLIPFKASNTSGGYAANGNYVVWSYDWYPIFIYDGKKWYENSDRYSMSTSKQMSQLRPYNAGETIKKSHSEMKTMI